MDNDTFSDHNKADQKIIEILNKNARTSSKDIALELRKVGHDVSDRTIRKRIERLEKSGIIKGYKAIITDITDKDEFRSLFLKFKISRVIDSIENSIKEFVTSHPNYLFVAKVEGDWDVMIVMKTDENEKKSLSKIVEKFSEHISDYKISKFDMKSVNILNMSLLLL